MKNHMSFLSKIGLVFVALILVIQTQQASGQAILLPSPDTTGGVPLMQAIASRQTQRNFSSKEIDTKTLGNLLYAAWGVSHDGKRTIPTAMNKQQMDVYVFMKSGTYQYDGVQHALIPLNHTDNRALFAMQDFVRTAPLTLAFVGPDDKYAFMHAGSAYQNVALYAASCGLNAVVRGSFDAQKVGEVLNLPADKNVLISQTLGWPLQ
ncbi:MAG: SagB/ThcOx family dehydrogenase [Alphaproteobacteria bacterium]